MSLLSTIGAASGRAFGLTRVSAAIRDAYFNLVTLLLPGNGTNGAQNNTFLDSSSNNFSITRNGNTTQGTFSPFSQTGWSTNFSSSSLTTNTALFNTGWGTTGASTLTATIDGWIYVNALGTTPTNVWWNPNVFAKGDNYMCLGVNSSGNVFFYHYDGTARTITSSSTISTNTWVYVAVTITGGTATLYINGTSVGSGTWYGIQSAGLTGAVTLGRSPNASGQYLNGYISNFRVSSVARTISTPTAAFASDGNTSLLTFQSNRFIDTSNNAYALTVETGTPSVQAFSPFAPTAAYSATNVGGSGYFDGTGDYLSAPNSTAFDFSTADFTIAVWVYPTTSGTTRKIATYSNGTASNSNYAFTFEIDTSNKAKMLTVNGTTISSTISTPSVISNAWNYLVVTRSGATVTVYVNGTGTSASHTTTINNPASSTLTIGAERDASVPLTGYMCGLKLLKGVSTAPSSTNPTTPPSSDANTSILLNYTNAGITDATAKNLLETVGNAQISTTQSKFGGSSMYFDGTGDGLQIPDTELFEFGSGDFTVECWIRFAALPANTGISAIVGKWDASSQKSWYMYVYNNAGTYQLYFSYTTNGSTNINPVANVSITTNTWYHMVACRNGANLRLFLDGTQVGTTYNSGTDNIWGGTYPIQIGRVAGTHDLNGFIDDLRITKGYARYTANFTAPTSAFPLQ